MFLSTLNIDVKDIDDMDCEVKDMTTVDMDDMDMDDDVPHKVDWIKKACTLATLPLEIALEVTAHLDLMATLGYTYTNDRLLEYFSDPKQFQKILDKADFTQRDIMWSKRGIKLINNNHWMMTFLVNIDEENERQTVNLDILHELLAFIDAARGHKKGELTARLVDKLGQAFESRRIQSKCPKCNDRVFQEIIYGLDNKNIK